MFPHQSKIINTPENDNTELSESTPEGNTHTYVRQSKQEREEARHTQIISNFIRSAARRQQNTKPADASLLNNTDNPSRARSLHRSQQRRRNTSTSRNGTGQTSHNNINDTLSQPRQHTQNQNMALMDRNTLTTINKELNELKSKFNRLENAFLEQNTTITNLRHMVNQNVRSINNQEGDITKIKTTQGNILESQAAFVNHLEHIDSTQSERHSDIMQQFNLLAQRHHDDYQHTFNDSYQTNDPSVYNNESFNESSTSVGTVVTGVSATSYTPSPIPTNTSQYLHRSYDTENSSLDYDSSQRSLSYTQVSDNSSNLITFSPPKDSHRSSSPKEASLNTPRHQQSNTSPSLNTNSNRFCRDPIITRRNQSSEHYKRTHSQ